MSVVLYDYWRSSAAYRVRIALNLAGITYDAVSVDLRTGEQRETAHLARNPQGLVPVLDIDGQRFTQSLAILEYLDETRGLGLLPEDPVARAQVRSLAMVLAVDVHPVCNLQVARYAAERTDSIDDAMTDWMQRFIGPGLAAFETRLAAFEQAPFCAGEKPGLADLCLMPQVYNADRWGSPRDALPRINAVVEACATHPAFAAAHPDAVRP